MDTHTPDPLATSDLIKLKRAIDQVQPFADYRGNIEALHAIRGLADAMTAVAKDFAFVSDTLAAVAAADDLVAMVRRIVTGPADGITKAAKLLLARLEA